MQNILQYCPLSLFPNQNTLFIWKVVDKIFRDMFYTAINKASGSVTQECGDLIWYYRTDHLLKEWSLRWEGEKDY